MSNISCKAYVTQKYLLHCERSMQSREFVPLRRKRCHLVNSELVNININLNVDIYVDVLTLQLCNSNCGLNWTWGGERAYKLATPRRVYIHPPVLRIRGDLTQRDASRMRVAIGGGKRGKKRGFVGGKRKVTPTGHVETSTPGATIDILFPRAFPRAFSLAVSSRELSCRDAASPFPESLILFALVMKKKKKCFFLTFN